MNIKVFNRFVRLIVILPVVFPLQIIGMLWEFWHFGPSQKLLDFFRKVPFFVDNFIEWDFARKGQK